MNSLFFGPQEMPKFLKPGKVVVLLQGKYAGKKAVLVKNYDDGTQARPYGHALVAGISSYPRKVWRAGAFSGRSVGVSGHQASSRPEEGRGVGAASARGPPGPGWRPVVCRFFVWGGC